MQNTFRAMSQISPIGSVVSPFAVQNSDNGWFSSKKQLPAPRCLVLYETQTSMRLGYVDEAQNWRRIDGLTENEKVISWLTAKIEPAVRTTNEPQSGNA